MSVDNNAPAPITLAFAADHAGFEFKGLLIAYAKDRGFTVIDLGTHNGARVDYPDFGVALAHTLLADEADFGIGICGSGIGMSIALNRFKGIRAALCHNAQTATLARQHNDANVLCLGARVINFEHAAACFDAFVETSFEGGRHSDRVAKLEAIS